MRPLNIKIKDKRFFSLVFFVGSYLWMFHDIV